MGFEEYKKDNRGKSRRRSSGNSRDRNRRFSDRKPSKRFSDRKSSNRSFNKKPSAKNSSFDKPKFDSRFKEQLIPIKFPNTFLDIRKRGLQLFTNNLNPGETYFEERVIHKNIEGKNYELRNWEYRRSKLGAAIANKVSQLGIQEGSKVLYLGASHGFTPSFVSDMVGEKGFVFCVDFAPRVVRDLYLLCQKRKNMAPIIADANKPEEYEHLISEVDVIFMDIAQREQVKIFLKNFKFLKKGGFGLLALKARSVDVTKRPKYVFQEAREELEKHIMIVDYKELEPYEKDHCFFVCKKK